MGGTLVGDRRHIMIWAATTIVLGTQSTSATAHTMAQVEAELVASESHVELVDLKAPDLTLSDLDGRKISLSDFRGKVTVLNFVEAGCRETCWSYAALIAKVQALQAEGLRDHVQFVSVATSSADTVAINAAMRERGLHPSNWIFLRGGTGDENLGQELAKAYRLELVRTGSSQQTPGAVMHVIDPEGRLKARFHGLEFNPSSLMLYTAALAHGGHAPVASEVELRDDLDRRFVFGAVSSGVGLLAFFAWISWSRRRSRR